jgi:hypothetical protein
VVAGQPAPDVATVPWVDEVENLTYSNPFGQEIGPVWYEGKLGYAIHGAGRPRLLSYLAAPLGHRAAGLRRPISPLI